MAAEAKAKVQSFIASLLQPQAAPVLAYA